jgi:large subunit ribosomal protein L6e
MLKQINDTILVTGPFKINGVPLRRINPAYVIATSTKVELPTGLSLDKFDEAYFKVKKEKKGKSTEQEFFGEGEKVHYTGQGTHADLQKKAIPEGRASDQKEVDKAIIQTITKTPHMRAYLASSFSLSKGDKPHLLKF